MATFNSYTVQCTLQVEYARLPVQGWMKQSWGRAGQREAASVWDPAGKAHPARAGGGRALPGDQGWAKKGPLVLCCSVTNWKSGHQNKHRDSIYIRNALLRAHKTEKTKTSRVNCSHQLTGQTESLTCAVHHDVLDDTKDLSVFVHEEVLWVCQAWEITQPAITNTVLTTHTN